MDSGKRQFPQQLGILTAGTSLVPLAQTQFPFSPERHKGSQQHRYAMLINLRRCIGYQACTVSCAIENQALQGESRTLVNRYQVQIEGQRGITSVLLPRLCNHCDNPPCVPVYPVQATLQREDGIVMVDNTHYVSCAYCVQACPYNARFVNHEAQTADKCTSYVRRLEAGLLPACVESYVGGARITDDIEDLHSRISQMLHEHHDAIKILKPENGTSPHVFYLRLGEAFVVSLMGHAQPALWQEVQIDHSLIIDGVLAHPQDVS